MYLLLSCCEAFWATVACTGLAFVLGLSLWEMANVSVGSERLVKLKKVAACFCISPHNVLRICREMKDFTLMLRILFAA